MTKLNSNDQLCCERCNNYKDDVKLQPKVWHNMLQDYLEAFICDDCLVKWGRKETTCPIVQP
jgi:hypothetical protein